MMRLIAAMAATAMLAGCGVLHLGNGGPPGLKVVGKSDYCGTASQNSEVHYFANPDAYDDWIHYRDINDLSANNARHGVIVVEMGQRPTGGYKLELEGAKTKIHGNTLDLVVDWHAPRLDAAVSQALTTQCIAVRPPRGNYHKIRVLDQIGNVRGVVKRSSAASH